MTEYIFDYDDRPVILVDFICADEKVSLGTLIDSGSDANVSFRQIGEFLGIKFSGRPDAKIESIGKTLKGWKRPVEIDFLGKKVSIDVIWVNKKVNVEEDLVMILGRDPIFNKFNVEFRDNNKVVFKNRS